jgi:hypothetical protein
MDLWMSGFLDADENEEHGTKRFEAADSAEESEPWIHVVGGLGPSDGLVCARL